MLAPDGVNKSFDANANGYVRGEGGAAIVIKKLSQAERDLQENKGGPILAVIRGAAVNQNGRSASFTAPNGSAQRDLLRDALRQARVSPQQVALVETHGTGTPLGDPIEWGALRDVMLQNSSTAPLIVGAVKSTIGM